MATLDGTDIKILLFLYHQLLLISRLFGPDIARKWRCPEFCIFVSMEGIKSYGAWIWSKTCHFHGCRWKKGIKTTFSWCLQNQQCDLLKVNRTNLKLVDIPERTPVKILFIFSYDSWTEGGLVNSLSLSLKKNIVKRELTSRINT